MPLYVRTGPDGKETAADVKEAVGKMLKSIEESLTGLRTNPTGYHSAWALVFKDVKELCETIVIQAEIIEDMDKVSYEKDMKHGADRHILLCLLNMWDISWKTRKVGTSLPDHTKHVLKEHHFPLEWRDEPTGFDAQYEEGMTTEDKLRTLMDNVSKMAYGRVNYGFDFAEAMNCIRYQTKDIRNLENEVKKLQDRIKDLEADRDAAVQLLARET